VKRFISESFGLGMLTTAAERHHLWELKDSDLHNFDVLPAKLAAQYPGSGIRPDLLFDFTSQGQKQRLAGESRGRSSARPVLPASKSQRERLTLDPPTKSPRLSALRQTPFTNQAVDPG